MNRKKIIICLNGKDQGHLENAFIYEHLANPHHKILEYKLESIVTQNTEENLFHSSKEDLHLLIQDESLRATLQKNQKQVSKSIKQKSSKKQPVFSSSIKDLITESQYADLLIIRNANFYADCAYYGQQKPMYELLKKTGCPLLVIPDKHFQIQQIVIIYDGSPSTMSAIKFLRSFMAPLCCTLPVTVFMACYEDTSFISSQEERIFIEYLRLHFKDLGIHKISENSVHTIHFALDPQKKILFVNNAIHQLLPDFIEAELEKLKLDQSQYFFSFIANIPSIS